MFHGALNVPLNRVTSNEKVVLRKNEVAHSPEFTTQLECSKILE